MMRGSGSIATPKRSRTEAAIRRAGETLTLLDPAVGSGHFLVAAVDKVEKHVKDAIAKLTEGFKKIAGSPFVK